MQHYDKIKELRQVHIRQSELLGELRQFIKEKCESERKFQNGERVSILNSKGEIMGDGIVTAARIYIDFEAGEIADYFKNEEKYYKALNNIRYQVVAVKKDGTASSRSAFGQRTYSDTPREYDYLLHIKKKATN